jgi:hypothetical protein
LKVLIQHIESLLPEHDCVVVPGLGGFVQNQIKARIQSDSSLFYPATKEIGFNPRLKFNDGLLAQSYQELFGMSFEEANIQIQQAVREITGKLEEGKFVRLGRTGTLSLNDEQLVFRPDTKNHFLPEAYGLSPFTFPLLNAATEKVSVKKPTRSEKKKDEFIHFRFHRTRFRQITVGIAACLFFVLLSKPAGKMPSNAQVAGMLPLGLPIDVQAASSTEAIQTPISKEPELKPDRIPVISNTTEPPVYVRPISENIPDQIAESTAIPASSVTEITSLDSQKQGSKVSETPTVLETSKAAITYYIIISTFSQKSTAEVWLSQHSNEAALVGASVVDIKGWARISTRSFTNFQEATNYLKKFTANYPEYGSAWIFTLKND